MRLKDITWKKVLSNLDAIITGTTLVICVVMANVNVIFRYFFNYPLRWGEEFITSLFVWTVFIGSSYAHRQKAHMSVDILVKMFPKKVRHIIEIVISVLELLILIMLTVISAQFCYHLVFNRKGELFVVMTEMLRIPKVLTAMAVPLGFGLSTIHSIRFLLTERLHILKKKEDSQEGGEKNDLGVY